LATFFGCLFKCRLFRLLSNVIQRRLFDVTYQRLFNVRFGSLLLVRYVCRLYTFLQYIINILEAGRWSISNNVQCSVSDEGNFVCRHVEQIRTAARDGDRAVNIDRTVSVEPRPSPSNQISQYQMFS
jgi:hypothetical protein